MRFEKFQIFSMQISSLRSEVKLNISEDRSKNIC